MKKDYRALYEVLIDGVKSEAPVLETAGGDCWAMSEAEEGMGLGMMTKGESIPALYPRGLKGLALREAAKSDAKSRVRVYRCGWKMAVSFRPGKMSRREAMAAASSAGWWA